MKSIGQVFGGDWTEQKLKRVRKYLQEYAKIMNSQKFNFAYVDAFAGTGYRKLTLDENENQLLFPELDFQDAVDFRQGSVQNALEIRPKFNKYIFIEQNTDNFSELLKLRDNYIQTEDFTDNDIECVRCDANEFLDEFCRKKWTKHRATVFLDPFGMQVEWKTIESIANTQAIDLWLLFPITAINRLLKRDGEICFSNQKKLNLVFGDDTWREVFYNTIQQMPTFEEQIQWEKIGNIFSEIEKYIVKRLKEIFSGVADNPLILRNSKNVPLYLLCFAANNPKGAPIAVRIAQHILQEKIR